jgi:hypothetical protein
MKKILMIVSALAFVASVSVSAPAVAAEPATKHVCHIKKGKEVCKDIKVRPKSAPLAKKVEKKPVVKKPVKKKKISN